MRNNVKVLAIACFWGLLQASCTKSYIIGGQTTNVNQYKDKTTYEVLSAIPQFSLLVQLIDAGGLQQQIDQPNTTFFAVQDSGINKYLVDRTIFLQASVNQYAKFTMDSLLFYVKNNINGTRDSLLMYLVPGIATTPANLSTLGAIYPTALAGDSAIISYEITAIGATSIVSTPPQVVYFTQLWRHYNLSLDSTAAIVPATTGVHTLVATSFINTSNGVINSLTYSAELFFHNSNH